MKTFSIEVEMEFESTRKIIEENVAYLQYLNTCVVEFEKGFNELLSAIEVNDFETVAETRHKLYPIFKLFSLDSLCVELKNIDNYINAYDSQHHQIIKNSFAMILRLINDEIVRISNQ
ncbi:MAG: hypothetical protein GC193_14185 [Cryomorphaceae bacterium]|nr:hypothetical protein [Cryomorphaceae bacterium]